VFAFGPWTYAAFCGGSKRIRVRTQEATTEWREHVCAENMHEYYNNKDVDVPTENRPGF